MIHARNNLVIMAANIAKPRHSVQSIEQRIWNTAFKIILFLVNYNAIILIKHVCNLLKIRTTTIGLTCTNPGYWFSFPIPPLQPGCEK